MGSRFADFWGWLVFRAFFLEVKQYEIKLDQMKKILKFDTGKKGFERAAYLLLTTAIALLVVAVVFLKAFF